MRSSSILTSLTSALVVTVLSPFALAQAPSPAPGGYPAPGQPAPGAQPWPGQVPGAQPAPGAYPGYPPGQPAPGAQPGYPPAQPAPGAQPGYPPAQAVPGQPVPGAQPYPGQPVPGAQPAPGAPPAPPGAGFGAAGALSADSSSGISAGSDVNAPPAEETPEDRLRSLQEHNTMFGATGLLRTVAASSGAAGTFRVHLLTDWFQTSSFLCYDANPCRLPGTPDTSSDSATHFGANVGLSVTPVSFLEAYATIRSTSNSNDRGRPQLLQVLGDTTIGVKAFTPNKLGQVFNFGGSVDMLLLNGAGGVGLDTGSTSFRLKALSTLDFRQPNDGGLPLRAHVNLGYHFDNSGALVESIETQRAAVRDQRGPKITRTERFGLGINRVDQFLIGIGIEGIFPVVRPFIEYNLGIAANRQSYACDPANGQFSGGDTCLASAGFSAMPSTLTLGLRAYPFLKGFEALAAFDIGTSGTSQFIEELAPTPAWDLWLGLGFAVDAVEPAPPKPTVVEKIVGNTNPERHIRGFVHEVGKQEGVANAIVRFEGRDFTGLATGADGRFVSANVDPGNYTMSIHADGYKDAQCKVAVTLGGLAAPPAAPGAPPGVPGAPGSPGAPPAPGAFGTIPGAPPPGAVPPGSPPGTGPGALPPGVGGAPGSIIAPPTGNTFVDVDCPLEANPRAGSITGAALDADTNSPVSGVAIRVIDTQGKEVGISADGNGGFHMEGLQPGTVSIKSEADGYMLHIQSVEVRLREDSRADLLMHKRPKKGDVEISGNEIRIKKQIHFETDSAKIVGDSTALLEEIADTLNRNVCLKQVEVQGHTDNTGAKEHNKVLSDQRANAVREWLLSHGVESGRLMAMGYGQDRPISPNVTPAGKERNRRVQFIIKDQDKGCGGKSAPASTTADKGVKAGGDTKPATQKKPLPF